MNSRVRQVISVRAANGGSELGVVPSLKEAKAVAMEDSKFNPGEKYIITVARLRSDGKVLKQGSVAQKLSFDPMTGRLKTAEGGPFSNVPPSERPSSRHKFRPGDRVEVMHGSGIVSGRQGTVVPRGEVKTDGRGIPTNVEGAYKPVDWRAEEAVKLDDGTLITMYRERLIPKSAMRKKADGIIHHHQDSDGWGFEGGEEVPFADEVWDDSMQDLSGVDYSDVGTPGLADMIEMADPYDVTPPLDQPDLTSRGIDTDIEPPDSELPSIQITIMDAPESADSDGDLKDRISDYVSDKENVEDIIRNLKDEVDSLVEDAEARGFDIRSSDEIADEMGMEPEQGSEPPSPVSRGLVPDQINETKSPIFTQKGQ